jgi:hypothetical protein
MGAGGNDNKKSWKSSFFVVPWTGLSALIKIAGLIRVSLSNERDMYIKCIILNKNKLPCFK